MLIAKQMSLSDIIINVCPDAKNVILTTTNWEDMSLIMDVIIAKADQESLRIFHNHCPNYSLTQDNRNILGVMLGSLFNTTSMKSDKWRKKNQFLHTFHIFYGDADPDPHGICVSGMSSPEIMRYLLCCDPDRYYQEITQSRSVFTSACEAGNLQALTIICQYPPIKEELDVAKARFHRVKPIVIGFLIKIPVFRKFLLELIPMYIQRKKWGDVVGAYSLMENVEEIDKIVLAEDAETATLLWILAQKEITIERKFNLLRYCSSPSKSIEMNSMLQKWDDCHRPVNHVMGKLK